MAEKLPTFAIDEIAARLPCEVDLVHMARACPEWRQALAQIHADHAPRLLPRLPWLVFPYSEGPSFCCLPCGDGVLSATHRMYAPEPDRTARYFGSHDGRWLMLAANRTASNIITNVLTGVRFSLPDKSIDIRGDTDFYMFMYAAALSSPPDEPGCVGAAIIQYMASLQDPRRIAFFCVGEGVEYAIDPMPEDYNEDPEDVIHFRGSFHVLTHEEQVRVCRPVFSNNGDVRFEWHFYYFPDGRLYNQVVSGRYLVESRGELLMVIKLSHYGCNPATGFRVFRMTQLENFVPIAGVTYSGWEELLDLDGRLLFIGRGCSRCYESESFPRFGDGLYFADDMNFYDTYRIVHNLPFPCPDNGRFDGIPDHPAIQRCFPMDQATSDYSSPVWILP